MRDNNLFGSFDDDGQINIYFFKSYCELLRGVFITRYFHFINLVRVASLRKTT